MDKSVQLFQFNDQPVRVIEANGEPWLVASDACKILGIANVSQATQDLDEDEKLIYTLHISGQNRKTLLISEAGLYGLVFVSRKPAAKDFKRWVKHEVLPAIRKTGKYEVPVQHLPTQEQMFTKAVQDRCIRNEKLLKPGVFCVVTEMYREAWTLEAFQHELKPSSLPDGSCGRKWRNWLIEQQHPLLGKSYQVLLHVPIERGHDLRSVWVYPLELLMVFRAWLRETYAEYYTVSYSPSRLLTSEAKAIAGPK